MRCWNRNASSWQQTDNFYVCGSSNRRLSPKLYVPFRSWAGFSSPVLARPFQRRLTASKSLRRHSGYLASWVAVSGCTSDSPKNGPRQAAVNFYHRWTSSAHWSRTCWLWLGDNYNLAGIEELIPLEIALRVEQLAFMHTKSSSGQVAAANRSCLHKAHELGFIG